MNDRLKLLLRGVLENPADLAARHVYADALQEAGDPRGEFIALQIQGHPGAEQLLKKHKRDWTAFLLPAIKQGYRFINGFVERITLPGEHLSELPRYFQHTPLREVRIRDLAAQGEVLAGWPEYSAIVLEARTRPPDEPVSFCGEAWPRDAQLVRCNKPGAVDLAPLAKLPELRALDLKSSGVTSVAPLAQLLRLEYLDLSGTQVSDVTPLVALRSLKHLSLARTAIKDASQLAPLLPTLDKLNLCDTAVDIKPSGLDDIRPRGVALFRDVVCTPLNYGAAVCELSCRDLKSPL